MLGSLTLGQPSGRCASTPQLGSTTTSRAASGGPTRHTPTVTPPTTPFPTSNGPAPARSNGSGTPAGHGGGAASAAASASFPGPKTPAASRWASGRSLAASRRSSADGNVPRSAARESAVPSSDPGRVSSVPSGAPADGASAEASSSAVPPSSADSAAPGSESELSSATVRSSDVVVGRGSDQPHGDDPDQQHRGRGRPQPAARRTGSAPVRAEVRDLARPVGRARDRGLVVGRERGRDGPRAGDRIGRRDVAERGAGDVHLGRPRHHVGRVPGLGLLGPVEHPVDERGRPLVACGGRRCVGVVRAGSGVVGRHGVGVGRSVGVSRFPSRSASWPRPRAMRDRTVPAGRSRMRPISA